MELPSLIFAVVAFIYGCTTTIALGFLALRLLFDLKIKPALFFAALSTASVIGLYIFNLQLRSQPVEWPFAPENIPFYLAQIYFCSYSLKILAKDWSPGSSNQRTRFDSLTASDIAAISCFLISAALYIFGKNIVGSILIFAGAIFLELGKCKMQSNLAKHGDRT